jgi:hypothetical protein
MQGTVNGVYFGTVAAAICGNGTGVIKAGPQSYI